MCYQHAIHGIPVNARKPRCQEPGGCGQIENFRLKSFDESVNRGCVGKAAAVQQVGIFAGGHNADSEPSLEYLFASDRGQATVSLPEPRQHMGVGKNQRSSP